ncbi:MAG: hypothetical protein HYZ75_09030 [Elusimicrobia bacterium]|nr:hypothetical protein [Elusimicrobiota bacterium]
MRILVTGSAPPKDAPAVWITENVDPLAKNIYGVTKTAAALPLVSPKPRPFVNALARKELGWRPRHDFMSRLAAGEDIRTPLALAVGSKDYHP